MAMLTFHVRALLIAADSGQPMVGYSIVAESGIDDESSPLCLYGIRAGNRGTKADGRFHAVFFTTGASLGKHDATPIPGMVEVHIEFRPGQWRCREVAVSPDQVVKAKGREVWLDLGQIRVDYDACRTPIGSEED
jgi:hypothetical protein